MCIDAHPSDRATRGEVKEPLAHLKHDLGKPTALLSNTCGQTTGQGYTETSKKQETTLCSPVYIHSCGEDICQ